MKRLILSLTALAALCTTASAEDNSFRIQCTTGETLEWAVPTLQKMTFQNGNVVLTKKDGTSTYTPISQIARMFIHTPGANSITAVGNDAQRTWDGSSLKVNANPGTPVRVFSINGAIAKQGSLSDNSTVELGELNKGMYIVNVNGQNYKIIKR